MSTTTLEKPPPAAADKTAPKFGDFGVAPRPLDVVQAELTESEARFAEWEKVNSRHHIRREKIITRRMKFTKEWASHHPGEPLEDEDIPAALTVPPQNSPVGVAFWKLHYTLEDLKAELAAAKRGTAR